MSSSRSGGSKLGLVAGLVILVGFFLPWVKACNQELTGYDIATNANGRVEEAWIYWLTLAAGVLCILLFGVVRTDTARNRVSAAVLRLLAGLIGFLPLLNIWQNVQERGGMLEILYGAWVVVAGYAGIALSSLVDFVAPAEKTEQDSTIHTSADIPEDTLG